MSTDAMTEVSIEFVDVNNPSLLIYCVELSFPTEAQKEQIKCQLLSHTVEATDDHSVGCSLNCFSYMKAILHVCTVIASV